MSKFSDIIKEYRETYLTEDKIRRFRTYPAWKRAVKAIDPNAEFHGDIDIDDAGKRGVYYAEWDGVEGTIEIDSRPVKEEINSNDDEEKQDPVTQMKKKKLQDLDKKITDETLKDKEEELKDLQSN